MPADTALQSAARMLMRTATLRRDRQDREDASEQDEERIARRMRKAERVRGGDVLARVPHRRGRREREQVEQRSTSRAMTMPARSGAAIRRAR